MEKNGALKRREKNQHIIRLLRWHNTTITQPLEFGILVFIYFSPALFICIYLYVFIFLLNGFYKRNQVICVCLFFYFYSLSSLLVVDFFSLVYWAVFSLPFLRCLFVQMLHNWWHLYYDFACVSRIPSPCPHSVAHTHTHIQQIRQLSLNGDAWKDFSLWALNFFLSHFCSVSMNISLSYIWRTVWTSKVWERARGVLLLPFFMLIFSRMSHGNVSCDTHTHTNTKIGGWVCSVCCTVFFSVLWFAFFLLFFFE